MKLRSCLIHEQITVAAMYREMIKEVYPTRKIGDPEAFAAKALEWFTDPQMEIYVTDTDGVISGFSASCVDRCEGLTSPIYNVMAVYVKPKFRNSKSAYMLYNMASMRAFYLKLPLYGIAFGEDAQGLAIKMGGSIRASEFEREFLNE